MPDPPRFTCRPKGRCASDTRRAIRSIFGRFLPETSADTDLIICRNGFVFRQIVSNTNNPKYIESFINKAKLKEYFKDYIAAAQLKIPKSEAIKKIIKDHNIDKAVYVGDTIKDKESSELANIPFIYAEYGFGDINHDISIKDISGLKNIISTVL